MKRNTRKFGLALTALTLVVLLLSVFGAAPVWADTITVGLGGSPTYDYATIQDAIDAASSGDTINVAAGTYSESNITINKPLTILGDPGDASPGPGSSAPVIDGGSAYGDAFKIANGVSNVTIQGFEVCNYATSGYNGVGNAVSAWVGSTSNITIQDNYFHNLGYNGVLVGNDKNADPSKWGDHTNWLIKGNVIDTFGYIGFELTNTSTSSIEGNVIHMTTPIIGAIFSSARRSETGLTIKDNLIDGSPSAAYPVIYIYAYDLDMPIPNLDSVLIQGNTIATTGTPYQVTIRNVGTGTITGVDINGNSLQTMRNLTASAVDATGNWWGTTDAVTIAPQISGSVDYSPWWGANYVGAAHPWTWYTNDSIQEAIDAASADDTINVAAGTYNEHVTINKSLTLQGAGASQTTIDVSGLFIQNPHIAVEVQNGVNNVVVDGFEIVGVPTFHHSDDSVIRCGGSIGTNNDVTISNNVIDGYMGILFKNGDSLTIQQNDITFNKDAVVIQYGCTNVDISDNTMTGGSSIDADPAGIYMTSTTGSITGNTIQNVIGPNNRGKGITGSSNYDLLIDDNVINNTGYDGISFWSNTHHVTISNNTLSNNAQTYTKGGGITIKGDDLTIINNDITGSGHDGVIIDTNVLDSVRIDINYNNIWGNANHGVNVKNAGETVDATCNWWGDNSGPTHSSNPSGIGDAVSDNVDFTPWLLSEDGPCIGGTPLGYKTAAASDLDALPPTGDKKTDHRIEEAIKHINKSLDGRYWVDDNHLDAKDGNKVFDEEKKAVKELEHLIKDKHVSPEVKDVCKSVIENLIEADELLAKTAYEEAQAGAGDPKVDKELEKAYKELEKAQEELDHTKKDGTSDPHYDKAIDHYKKAWEHACKAQRQQLLPQSHLPFQASSIKVVAYPNPIRDVNTATFQVMGTLAAEVEEIRVQIYDLSGRLVWEDAALGSELDWHTDSLSGEYLANGIYLYRVQVRIGGSWINQDIGKIAVLR